MAFIRGKTAEVYITDVGGTSRNITGFCDNTDLEWGRESYDATTYGTGGRQRVPGFVDFTGTLTGKWDNAGTATPDEWFTGLINDTTGTVTSQLTIFPAGSATGRPYHRGRVLVSNYSVGVPYDGLVTWSLDYELADGTVTRGTV